MRVVDIKNLLGENCKIIGDANRKFYNARPIHKAQNGDLTFCVRGKEDALRKTKASVIICDYSLCENVVFDNKTLVTVKSPKLSFMRCLKTFLMTSQKVEIHPTAIIGKRCKIGENVSIGAYTVIIGDVKIGNNVTIQAGCIIGVDGFNYERCRDGTYKHFPHVGGVVIGDNVEIGANTCVDRGTLSDTIIGDGTKISTLVHIGHNCIIGKNCIIAGMALVGGRVELGDNVWIGPHAVVCKSGTKLGTRALVGIGSVVLDDVGENDVVAGVPAKFLRKRGENEEG